MAYTFSQLVTSIYNQVDRRNTRLQDFIRETIIRQLAELSSHRTLFMEETASFTIPLTNPHAGEYADTALTGFPADVMEIDTLWYLSGTQKIEVPGPVPHAQVRLFNSPVSTPTPSCWSWFDGKLWVAPKLSAAKTFYIDYFKDATRDNGGGVLSTASTTSTNPWFDRGEPVLRYAVLAEVYSSHPWLDQPAAENAATLRNRFLDTLKQEAVLRKGAAFQAPAMLGEQGYGTWNSRIYQA
jgi:hypothetical protein